MSTKCYNAYRIPASRVAEFVRIMDAKMLNALADRFLSRLNAPSSNEPEDLAVFQQQVRNAINRWRIAALSLQRDEDNFTFQFAIWFDGKWALVRAFGESFALGDFEKALPKWAQDYHYQNSSDDRPKGVSKRAWEARRKAWDRVYCTNDGHTNHMKTMLVHNVTDIRPPDGYLPEMRFLDAVRRRTTYPI